MEESYDDGDVRGRQSAEMPRSAALPVGTRQRAEPGPLHSRARAPKTEVERLDPSAQPQLDRQAAFWDARSEDYPDPSTREQMQRLLERLARLPQEARPAAGLRLLDVGAGAGAISLHAARAGAVVTALDVSSAMLRRLEAAGQKGIETLVADWRAFDIDAAGFRRAFDLVYAQMVPSFRDVADFARFEACSRGWCVFIGWGRERRRSVAGSGVRRARRAVGGPGGRTVGRATTGRARACAAACVLARDVDAPALGGRRDW